MLVMNATNESQTTVAFGNYFTFKPKEMKRIKNDDIARWIGENRLHQGLFSLGDEFEDPDYRATDEAKATIKELEESALKHYVDSLRKTIYNNQVSLRQDLERANIKADPATFASEGELKAMRLVAQYQKANEDAEQAKINEVKRLIKETGTGNR